LAFAGRRTKILVFRNHRPLVGVGVLIFLPIFPSVLVIKKKGTQNSPWERVS